MVQCSFCCTLGHSIRTCQVDGAERERQRRASNPKVIAQREKTAAKRAERNENEGKRLQISRNPKSLHVPEVVPGRIKEEFGETASTIQGAVDLALPKAYLLKILTIVNENR